MSDDKEIKEEAPPATGPQVTSTTVQDKAGVPADQDAKLVSKESTKQAPEAPKKDAEAKKKA